MPGQRTSAAAAGQGSRPPVAAAHARGATGTDTAAVDLAGIGIGPCNLSLAALAHGIPGLRTVFYEQRGGFHWHPGLLIDGATLQVPFLADLVTLADPANPWSFLSYLKAHDRLFPFYFAERFHIERAEYDAYCRWVSEGIAASSVPSPRSPAAPARGRTSLHFGHRVDAVRWNGERDAFEVDFTELDTAGGDGSRGRSYARNLVLGVGSEPQVPEPLRPLTETAGAVPETGAPVSETAGPEGRTGHPGPAVRAKSGEPGEPGKSGRAGAGRAPVIHSADYLAYRAELSAAGHVTVIGSGQSGAEVFLDLLRHREPGREGLHWLTRSPAFAPMEYSKLGLEHFTPDYTRYFHSLPQGVRDRLVRDQWQLHKGVGHGTLGAIHDELYHRTLGGGWPDTVLTPGVTVRAARRPVPSRVELDLEHAEQGARSRLTTDAVVLATGYRERPLEGLLAALAPCIGRDSSGRPRIDEHYRLVLGPSVRGAVHVQNAEQHTHGVGAPDLGLSAHRSAVILNSLTGEERYRLPARTAFTTFGLGQPERAGAETGTGAEAGTEASAGSGRGGRHVGAGQQGARILPLRAP